MLTVADNGCGMDDVTLARAFEPFFTTKAQGRGTGLGLATVYGIVKQSGGYIEIGSVPGQGTVVRVYIPRAELDLEVAELPVIVETTLGGVETVLLVEDDDALRLVVQRQLRRRGYTVLDAPDGTEALRLMAIHGKAVRIVISDLVMPKMSGRELADRVRAEGWEPLVLFISGYTNDAIMHRGAFPPGCGYLQKPFSAEALARTIRSALDARPAPPAHSTEDAA
jgi:CheY-like chemotaxis protein